MAVARCLLSILLASLPGAGCRRASQTWSQCTHDKPVIELGFAWQETDSTSRPRGYSGLTLQLEDTIRNARLNIEESYLNDDGDSTFRTSRCKGHVVATYYCEEMESDHRLILEFVRTAQGIGVQRAAYFRHTHEPPAPAWDGAYDPPQEVHVYERFMALPSNLTLPLNVKSLTREKPLVLHVTIPAEAVPSCLRTWFPLMREYAPRDFRLK